MWMRAFQAEGITSAKALHMLAGLGNTEETIALRVASVEITARDGIRQQAAGKVKIGKGPGVRLLPRQPRRS